MIPEPQGRAGLHKNAWRAAFALAAVSLLPAGSAAQIRAPGGQAGQNADASDRKTAQAQFVRAEKLRQNLESLPEGKRPLQLYTAAAAAYRDVYLITPHAAEVPESLNQVGALYRAMGNLFDVKYYRSSVEAYQFLLREYPENPFHAEALLAIAAMAREELHDTPLARDSYTQFLAAHPRSSHTAEVRSQLALLNQPATTAKSGAIRPDKRASGPEALPKAWATPGTQSRSGADGAMLSGTQKIMAATDTRDASMAEPFPARKSGPQVTRVRTWNADSYTRIVIDVGSDVQYRVGRVADPDRIYFDLSDTTVSAALLRNSISVPENSFLRAVRVAQNQAGVARVVLELGRIKDYSVFLVPDPYRLVVDVYGESFTAGPSATTSASASGTRPQHLARNTSAERDSYIGSPAGSKTPSLSETSFRTDHTTPGSFQSSPSPSSSSQSSTFQSAASQSWPVAVDGPRPARRDPMSGRSAKGQVDPERSQAAVTARALSSAPAAIEPSPLDARLAAPGKARRSAAEGDLRPRAGTRTAHEQAEELGPAAVPELTRDGQRSLTRVLGLKVGRIVIDAGHGGHDTGTIGPSGLMEKDLCLDVALRVGKLIHQRLPGAEVVYTREDDTFVPLEQRTEIANEARADLFVSVHANSSEDQKARGVETYYLNFTGSDAAMEVASRENALSENGVHDLQDIVRKIARNEKVEESRDLAGMIQDSVASRVTLSDHGDLNRGVRKAPFVVLIGANMPSVLSEISFISNAADEQWLKKPEGRQSVAEGLYQGIQSYLQRTNSLSGIQNQARPTADARPAQTRTHGPARSGVLARSVNPQ